MSSQDILVSEVVISWRELKSKKYLEFVFLGDFSESEAEEAIEKWDQLFSSIPESQKANLIWNCNEMKKFTSGAAKIWKGAMSKFGHKIDTIWLISSNSFIRMGAKTVTFLLPVNLKAVTSEDDII